MPYRPVFLSFLIVFGCLLSAPVFADDNTTPKPMPLNGTLMPPSAPSAPTTPSANDQPIKAPVVTNPTPTPAPAPTPAPKQSDNRQNPDPKNGNATGDHDQDDNRHHRDHTVYVPYPVPYPDYYYPGGVIPAPTPPAPKICAAQNVSVCGISVAVPAGAQAGDMMAIDIPDPSFADTDPYAGQSFTVRCASYSADDTPFYEVVNADGLSCNAFPCQDAKFRMCNTTVTVPGGTPMGNVLQMNMPKPFTPDPFAVQCIGSNGQAPRYQMMDNSSVTCQLAKQRP